MDFKRIVLLSGHYGSGKTNIAVNLALRMKAAREKVAIADIDIVNPYFRTKDSQAELEKAGIRLICSDFAGSNVDLPALPQDVYAITDEPDLFSVIDVGGDDRGALALGRWRDAILRENDYEMLFVVNRFRPLTADALSTIEVMREIELASGMPFTAVVNNSNLGEETTVRDVPSAEDDRRSRGAVSLAGQPDPQSVSNEASGQNPLRQHRRIARWCPKSVKERNEWLSLHLTRIAARAAACAWRHAPRACWPSPGTRSTRRAIIRRKLPIRKSAPDARSAQ